ncbi:MAG: hypothetical protein ACLSVG_11985, partial [Clostridia bacterium]
PRWKRERQTSFLGCSLNFPDFQKARSKLTLLSVCAAAFRAEPALFCCITATLCVISLAVSY